MKNYHSQSLPYKVIGITNLGYFIINQVHYIDLNGTGIKLIESVEYDKTKENWPEGITAGLFINPEKVYLVRKGMYCKRPWVCDDKKKQCVS